MLHSVALRLHCTLGTNGVQHPAAGQAYIRGCTYCLCATIHRSRNMTLTSGTYTIRNVYYKTYATLKSADEAARLISTPHGNDAGRIWEIKYLADGKYTIRNHKFQTYAHCSHHAVADEQIVGSTYEQEWAIQEEAQKNHYTISPIEVEIFWGLTSGEEGTPVTLRRPFTDESNQWIITAHEVHKPESNHPAKK
ncbi:uncharacterized protein LAESUDRAFT_816156 [Laetiporus sulphureus 93-53]|uniref:Ricin B lectin domain-containing protein n=1 Tax=Laetiporus sulphureus 93-53 TaxID=1314785 RepID=A0A165BFT6_9APHY|nr:uncharacterized protein LAESUDRAFT_816156 [Laetiporus sulphureus 93-53]KZT00966.1 hypothetical protein LAESUDRAFT_816156 [Laetiporus sulphureus 93-53]